jgi:hypothetical protein
MRETHPYFYYNFFTIYQIFSVKQVKIVFQFLINQKNYETQQNPVVLRLDA